MTIKDNNKLIMKFMGDKYESPGNYICNCDELYTCDGCIESSLHETNGKYHEDWNEIMRVIEKIESLGYFVEIQKLISGSNLAVIKYNKEQVYFGCNMKNKLTALYNIIIKFIKNYKTEKL